MSSEKNNMINLGNYEEYFILYMDNELNAGEKLMVESFLSANSDLRAELDMLLSTKLPLEDISFPGKDELISRRMKMDTADESLLLYIDGEAGTGENKIKHQLKTDKEFQLEYDLLMRTKLDASEVIRYPNKKELYRRTEKVAPIGLWMKIAAAVVIILFATAILVMNTKGSKTPEATAHHNPANTINTQPDIKNETPSPVHQKEELIAVKQQAKKVVVPGKEILPPKENHQPENIQQNNSVPNNNSVVNTLKNKVDVIDPAIGGNVLNNPFNNLNVTSSNPTALHITEDPHKGDVVEEPKSNKSAFKGFLRKAARVIERKTGIGAANDDDELLIGVVAVKLK